MADTASSTLTLKGDENPSYTFKNVKTVDGRGHKITVEKGSNTASRYVYDENKIGPTKPNTNEKTTTKGQIELINGTYDYQALNTTNVRGKLVSVHPVGTNFDKRRQTFYVLNKPYYSSYGLFGEKPFGVESIKGTGYEENVNDDFVDIFYVYHKGNKSDELQTKVPQIFVGIYIYSLLKTFRNNKRKSMGSYTDLEKKQNDFIKNIYNDQKYYGILNSYFPLSYTDFIEMIPRNIRLETYLTYDSLNYKSQIHQNMTIFLNRLKNDLKKISFDSLDDAKALYDIKIQELKNKLGTTPRSRMNFLEKDAKRLKIMNDYDQTAETRNAEFSHTNPGLKTRRGGKKTKKRAYKKSLKKKIKFGAKPKTLKNFRKVKKLTHNKSRKFRK